MIDPGRSYTVKELRDAYAISYKVLRAWLKPILKQLAKAGYVPGQRMLTPRQVEMIINQVGPPAAKP